MLHGVSRNPCLLDLVFAGLWCGSLGNRNFLFSRSRVWWIACDYVMEAFLLIWGVVFGLRLLLLQR